MDELVATRTCAQARERVGNRGIGQIHPANDAKHKRVRGGDTEELTRFVEIGARLDKHRARDRIGGEERLQIVGRKGPPDAGKVVAHPRIRPSPSVPEVVVRIDNLHVDVASIVYDPGTCC